MSSNKETLPLDEVPHPVDQEFDVLYSRAGRKRRARRQETLLRECTCGVGIGGGAKTNPAVTIKCRQDACETGWVSALLLKKKTYHARSII